MSSESCAKAHLLCSQTQESTVVAFLKAQIGYRKGDSGWQLSQSDAGLRFLALTACLLTIDWWGASVTLRQLIIDSAADRMLVPSSHQIKQLLEAVNYRLARSGFADNVIGWGVWPDKNAKNTAICHSPPSSTTLIKLIKAISNLARLGQTHSVHVKVYLTESAWIIAFIKWCLGAPPTVILQHGAPGLVQDDCQVFVYPLADERAGASGATIIAMDDLGAITELLSDLPSGSGDFNAMLRVPSFAYRLLRYFGPEDSLKYRAGREAIMYGCRPVLDNFKPGYTGEVDVPSENTTGLSRPAISSEEETGMLLKLSALQGTLFPDEDVIAGALAQFLGLNSNPTTLKQVAPNTLVEDLPSIQMVKTLVQASCPCMSCLGTTKVPKQRCAFELYMRTVSYCVATIFLISLLIPSDPDGVFLRYHASAPNTFNGFASAVYECIQNKGAQTCEIAFVVHEVLKFVGHREELDVGDKTWIMSALHGQTVYPEVLGNLTLRRSGLLRLLCVPGSLTWRNEAYSLVGIPPAELYYDDSSADEEENVQETFPNLEMKVERKKTESISRSSRSSRLAGPKSHAGDMGRLQVNFCKLLSRPDVASEGKH
jgi:hypothetical protein